MIYDIVQSINFDFLVTITTSSNQISGHKTDIAFQRYNLVTEEEIHRIKWLDKKDWEPRTMDTYYGHQSGIMKARLFISY